MVAAVVSPNRGGLESTSGADKTRQRIMRATMECFRECGYEKSSMKRIAARAGVSQALLHYHFETKAKLFESTMLDLAQTLFATASPRLPRGKPIRDSFAEAANLLYALFINNLDAVTFMVEFAAAANHTEFLRTAYMSYRDTQRRQVADVLYGIAGDRAPSALIDETARLIETGLLGMSMQRPFIADEPTFRADFEAFFDMISSHFTDGLHAASA